MLRKRHATVAGGAIPLVVAMALICLWGTPSLPAKAPNAVSDAKRTEPGSAKSRLSEALLPAETKAFVSIPDMEQLRLKWSQTQLGRMFEDPVMEQFRVDLRKQIENKLSETDRRLGITLEDLEGVPGGEVSLSSIQPGGDEKLYALVLLVDVTGKLDRANELLAKVSENLIERGSKKSTLQLDGHRVVAFQLPKKRTELTIREAFYLIHKDWLIATDQKETMVNVLARLDGRGDGILQNEPAFLATSNRCREEIGDLVPHIRWFVEPFGYAEVIRAAAGGRKVRGRDKLKVLANQGFDAVKGMGGFIVLATEEHDLLHRSFVFAPPLAEGKRFESAARMLDFPNGQQLKPLPWVPQDVASHITINWRMRDAFFFSKSLVNEMADDEIFDDIWESIAKDPNGPRVDVPKELVSRLGERATLITSRKLPIGPKSEQRLYAFELTDPEDVLQTVNRAMARDPGAKERKHGEYTIWEIVDADKKRPTPRSRKGFERFGKRRPEPARREQQPMIKNGALTVAYGHLMFASDVDFIIQVLNGSGDDGGLGDCEDYQSIDQALANLGAGNGSMRYFSRTSRSHHTNYELFRQGKMPQAESLLGQLLNALMAPDEEGVLRKPKFDGGKLPEFDAVRDYLGTLGVYVISEENGWYVAGCLLKDTP